MASGMRLRKGDEVMVIAGKDRGKKGRVQEVSPSALTVVVAGLNIAKRHRKPNPSKNEKGGIIDEPRPLALGKVMVVCAHCGKPTRVAHRLDEDNKERVCKKCGETIVVEDKA